MNITTFQTLIDIVFQNIANKLDAEEEYDIDYTIQGSVLTIEFADKKQIIINEQAPLLELWLASPLGAYHFSYKTDTKQWINYANINFWDALESACTKLGAPIRFNS